MKEVAPALGIRHPDGGGNRGRGCLFLDLSRKGRVSVSGLGAETAGL